MCTYSFKKYLYIYYNNDRSFTTYQYLILYYLKHIQLYKSNNYYVLNIYLTSNSFINSIVFIFKRIIYFIINKYPNRFHILLLKS